MPKASDQANLLFPYLLPKLARALNGNGGGSGGTPGVGGAPSPHDLSSVHHSGTLASSQAPQFLLADGTRPLTGNLSVNAGITIDGVDLSAHVADPDAHHDRASVGNTGLTITGQQISLNLAATNSGLEIVSGLRIDEDADFLWTNTHQFNSDPQVSANLDFIGGSRSITGSNSLTISPATDLTLDPGGLIVLPTAQELKTSTFNDFVAGIAGLRHWDTGGNVRQLTIGKIKADELHVRIFSADENRVSRAAEFWTYSFGIVETEFTIPADEATVDVWFEEVAALGNFKIFLPNHWILIRQIDVSTSLTVTATWYQVVDAGANDYVQREDADNAAGKLARQQWRLRRKSGGTTGIVIRKGNVAVDFGLPFSVTTPAPGQGIVHLSALHEDGGPFLQIQTFESVSSDVPQFKNRVRMGNLTGTVDYSSDIFGFATGDDLSVAPSAGFSGLTADQTNGLRLFNTDLEMYISGDPVFSIRRTEGIRLLQDTDFQDNDYTSIAWYLDINSPTAPYSMISSYSQGTTNDSIMFLRSETPTAGDMARIDVFTSAGGSGTVNSAQVRATAQDALSEVAIFAEGDGTTPGDAKIAIAAIGTSSLIQMSATEIRMTGDVLPDLDIARDLGSAAKRWDVIYANQMIISGSISGATLSGSEWEHSGSIVIDANSASSTTVSITNQGAGVANLAVDNNITLGGTVDGVDISAHAASSSAHHDPVTVGNTGLSLSTQVISLFLNATASGLEISSGLRLADSIAGAGLTISSKVLAVGAGDGITVNANDVAVDSTVVRTTRTITSGSGLTGGGDLSANRTLAVGAGDGITVNADDVAVNSTVARNTWAVNAGSGLTGGGNLAAAGITLNVGAGNGITVAADSVAVNQGFSFTWTAAHQFNEDLRVGADVLLVDYSGENVGINRPPDPQFALDVNGPIRGTELVGRHAIQLEDVALLLHFDGGEPYESNYTGELNAMPLGQVPAAASNVHFRPGHFYKAVVMGRARTNLSTNPSFETNGANWNLFNGAGGNLTITRDTTEAWSGSASAKLTWTAVDNSQYFTDAFTASSGLHSCGVWMKAATPTTVDIFIQENVSPFTIYGSTSCSVTEDWQFFFVRGTPGSGTATRFNIVPSGSANTVWVDAITIEANSTPSWYFDGSLGSGFAWTGTAHLSASTRSDSTLSYFLQDMVAHRWTVMGWFCWPFNAPPVNNGIFRLNIGTGQYLEFYATTNSLFTEVVHNGGTNNPPMRNSNVVAGEWFWYAFSYTPGSLRYYENGALVQTLAFTFNGAPTSVNLGFSGSSNRGDLMIDDFVVSRQSLSDERVRAIYESDAPVFAESSVFHFRATAKGLVWADEEGLWMRNLAGDEVLGAYGGESTKSWAGLTLSPSDFVLGDVARGAYMQWDDSAGTIIIGKTGASASRLFADGGAVRIYSNDVERFAVSSGGVLRIRDSNANAVFTFDASAGAEFTLPLTLGTAGGIYQGTGTFSSPTTGLKIWNDGGIGRIGGFSGGTAQWYANTDGKLYAGGGNVIQDANGLSLIADTPGAIEDFPTQRAVFWKKSGVNVAAVSGQYISSFDSNFLHMIAKGNATGIDGTISIAARHFSGAESSILMSSSGLAIESPNISIDANGGPITLEGNVQATGTGEFNQLSGAGAVPTLNLSQSDLSEEFIQFTATVGAGNPIEADTTPPASPTHKIRVSINGTLGYFYFYAS